VARRKGFKVPGVSFSLNRALGITQAKQRFARKTGIPTSKAGLQRKIGKAVMGGGCLLSAVSFFAVVAALIGVAATLFV
jgi:hypothetical protein